MCASIIPFIPSLNDQNQLSILKYFEKEGVSLNRENVVKNPVMRALAKLCLNSLVSGSV